MDIPIGDLLAMFSSTSSRPLSRLECLFDRSAEVIDFKYRAYYQSFSSNLPSDTLYAMLSTSDLLNMRVVSKISQKWAERDIDRLFSVLYISPRYSYPHRRQSKSGLQVVGQHCRELIVRLTDRPASGVASHNKVFVEETDSHNSMSNVLVPAALPLKIPKLVTHGSHWPEVFDCLEDLEILTISAPEGSGSIKAGQVQSTLICVRIAFEQAYLPLLHTLRLTSFYCLNLVHFCWAGGTAFVEASWWASRNWSKVKTIEAQLVYPLKSTRQPPLKVFHHLFHSWLESFSQTLLALKVFWVGDKGPNPLMLDCLGKAQNFSPSPIYWKRLSELWLGNVTVDLHAIETTRLRAPKMQKLMVCEGAAGYPGEWEQVLADDGIHSDGDIDEMQFELEM